MLSGTYKLKQATFLWVLAGFFSAYAIYLGVTAILPPRFYTLTIFCVCVAVFFYTYAYNRNEVITANIFTGIFFFIAGLFIYRLALSYLHIPEWDFLCFYLFAKAGLASHDFYNPQVYARVFNELNLHNITDKNFIDEVVNVGFWYPPPSMFIFLLAGLFDLNTGYVIWQTLVITFLVIDIVLLTRFYLKHTKRKYNSQLRMLIPLLLLILFPDLSASVFYSQTIGLFLFLLLLLIYYIESWKAGIFIVLLFIIKPLAAFFILYFIFFKKWKTIVTAAITGIISLGVTVLVFGYQSFTNYMVSPPTNRIPDFIYLECSSLFGLLRRMQQKMPDYLTLSSVKIIYYIVSATLVVCTFLALRNLSKISNILAFVIFVPLALIIYPATLFHYNIMLLPIVLYIFTQKLSDNPLVNCLAVLILYIVGMYNLLLFNLLLWSILAGWPLLIKIFKNKNIELLVVN